MKSMSQIEDVIVDISPKNAIEQLMHKETINSPLLLELPISSLQDTVKRGIDILGAIIGLSVLLLLLPGIAVCIFLEDRGPVFYKQTRIGQYGKTFFIYKIRSMVVDADKQLKQNPELLKAWSESGKLQTDPRITRVGSFLRRTSIDELPQMWNVLCGEMSLVGPRAIQSSEIAAFGELFELRQMVKPGVTGLWQIGGRSTTDYQQRCLLDCTYVMDKSLQMDMYIVLKTIPAIIYGVGAY